VTPGLRSVFCTFLWPRHPGHSGGEIRDLHLIAHLATLGAVELLALYPGPPQGQEDVLAARVTALTCAGPGAPAARAPSRAFSLARVFRRPPRLHQEAAHRLPHLEAGGRRALQAALDRAPDLLFVSPQLNPIGLTVRAPARATRAVLATYDVEAERLERLAGAEAEEARRAAAFERANLRAYDGVIAVSERDRRSFVSRYGLDPARVCVVENGVDLEYFAFRERPAEGPVVFVASLGYPPNAEAAARLARGVMPRVRARRPGTRLALVGQGAESLPADLVDGATQATGRVPDVRPYLAGAAVACVPLRAGSGTKYKVLEALAAGVPVVCTPVALEGLALEPGVHALVGDTDEELAAAVCAVLADPGLARRLAAAGRARVEERHAWSRVLEGLEPWLRALRARPRARRGAPALA
jgi:glycosyltransferase involved in cell wall biosynthesis